jgi:hypothetical protein
LELFFSTTGNSNSITKAIKLKSNKCIDCGNKILNAKTTNALIRKGT